MPDKFHVSLSHPHPEDLASGRVVAPGDEIVLLKDEQKEEHNQRLIEGGILLPADADAEEEEAETPPEVNNGDNNGEGGNE